MAIYLAIYSKCIAIKDFFQSHFIFYSYKKLSICETSLAKNNDNILDNKVTNFQLQDSSQQSHGFGNSQTELMYGHTPNSGLLENFSFHDIQKNSDMQHLDSIATAFESNDLLQIRSMQYKASAYESASIFQKSKYFDRILQYKDAPYNFSAQLFSIDFSWIQKSMYFFGFLRNEFCVLSPDSIQSVRLDIKKSQLQKQYVSDLFAILKAQSLGLVPSSCESRYFVQNISNDEIAFQIFYVKEETLYSYTAQSKGKIFCFNPFIMFCSLHRFYPNLRRYTIIFQDKNTHALCHYANGLLEFCVVLERKEALQNYYNHIPVLGEIFYCDWSGDRALLCDFMPIESLFQMPLHDCLHVLALHHMFTVPIETNFYLQSFYSFVYSLKLFLICILGVLFVSLFSFLYDKYQYYQFIQTQEKQYYDHIQYQYEKKQNYTPMYDRIYENLIHNKSLNFCFIKQYEQIEGEFQWIDMTCDS